MKYNKKFFQNAISIGAVIFIIFFIIASKVEIGYHGDNKLHTFRPPHIDRERWLADQKTYYEGEAQFLESVLLNTKGLQYPGNYIQTLSRLEHDEHSVDRIDTFKELYSDEIKRLIEQNSIKAESIIPIYQKIWREKFIIRVEQELQGKPIQVKTNNDGKTIIFISDIFANKEIFSSWHTNLLEQRLTSLGYRRLEYKLEPTGPVFKSYDW